MSMYLIMCKSLTYAQRAQRVLERAGISSYIKKAPIELTEGGCGYALGLNRDLNKALVLLEQNKLLRGKIFTRQENGEYREAGL